MSTTIIKPHFTNPDRPAVNVVRNGMLGDGKANIAGAAAPGSARLTTRRYTGVIPPPKRLAAHFW